MSHNIIKNKRSVNTKSFQFTPFGPMSGEEEMPRPMSELEAEAELDAFENEERFAGKSHSGPMGGKGGGEAPDVQAIIERAQQDAEAIIRDANERASHIEREAYEKGEREGRKTGEIMAEQQLQAVLNHYHAGITALDQMREILVNQMQLDIVDLVMHTAEKVVETELKLRAETIVPILKKALQKLKSRKNVTIYLNPDDHGYIQQLSEGERQQWFGSQVHWETDPSLNRGSIRIESEAGELDATLATKLAEIKEQLREAIEQS